MKPSPSAEPLIAGALLLGMGLLLRQWQPGALTLPDTDDTRRSNDRGLARAARRGRDGIAWFLPRNLTGSVGRSLLIMGAGLIFVRALDELVEDDDALF